MVRLITTALALATLAACSSSLGGGSSAPAPQYIVVPPGARLVCENGRAPPCE